MRPQLNGGTLARQEISRATRVAEFFLFEQASGRVSRELGDVVPTGRRLDLPRLRSRLGFRRRWARARPRARLGLLSVAAGGHDREDRPPGAKAAGGQLS